MSLFNGVLFVIPARGGSKGIPNKNIKDFLGKPLIYHSIEYARNFVSDEFICLSSDDNKIIKSAEQIGLNVPFVRPEKLATDFADSFSVLKHAVDFYENNRNMDIKAVVLLQPTSPIREFLHLEEAMKLYNSNTEMVVSVCESKNNPYYSIFEEDNSGFLHISKGDGSYTRRQDVPKTYEYNGSIYIINAEIFKVRSSFKDVQKKIKYVMPEKYNIDLDTLEDWNYAEYRFTRGEI